METMKYRETKKSSYKGHVFFVLMFLIVGALIIYFAICTEKEPAIIGQAQSDINISADIEESDALIDTNIVETDLSKIYKIEDKVISDTSMQEIKANIVLPVISINEELLTDVNDEIYNKFNNTYNSFKETMKDANNDFTYKVTYKVYNNIIKSKNILTITLYERIRDDSEKTNSMEKVYAYNINLETGDILKQEDIVADILGSSYKDEIKKQVKEYLVSRNMITESEYNYSYTGLEVYYIKENKFHLLFDTGEIVDDKYSIQDITIEVLEEMNE